MTRTRRMNRAQLQERFDALLAANRVRYVGTRMSDTLDTGAEFNVIGAKRHAGRQAVATIVLLADDMPETEVVRNRFYGRFPNAPEFLNIDNRLRQTLRLSNDWLACWEVIS